jgi:hypothetical protein
VTRFEEVGKFPGRTTALLEPTQRQRIYTRLESGEMSLRDFARMVGPDGAEQVYFRTPGGRRFIDHVFPAGDHVVLRESKNVSDFAITTEIQSQLKADMFLLDHHPEAVVHWRISGNGQIAPQAFDLLQAMVERTGGRFRFQLQDSALPPFEPSSPAPTLH